MGFWPFGGGGKRQRMTEKEERATEVPARQPSDEGPLGEKAQQDVAEPSRSSRAQHEPSKKITKSRNPSTSRSGPAGLPEIAPRRSSRTNSQYGEKALYQHNPMSQSSLGPENFSVTRMPPTLHAKRAETEPPIPRRKSSKRKAEEYARERERDIKALSSSPIPVPKRSATSYNSGPLQRDTRQIPGALNRKLERPTSEVSLPLMDALPDVDDMPNQNSFRVGMFATLSPRPTLRYENLPRTVSGKQSIRQNVAIQRAIAEEDTSDKKRINELADDLDANGLRELMERDRRRRERKKETDDAKLRRRLRRTERQREEDEARRARTEAYVRQAPLAGDDMASSTIESSPLTAHPTRTANATSDREDPFTDEATIPAPVSHTQIRNPFEDEKDEDIMQVQRDLHDQDEIPIPARSPLRNNVVNIPAGGLNASRTTMSPPRSPIQRPVDRLSFSQGSASVLGREVTPDITESAVSERRVSEQSGPRLSSWTTFFKRGTRRKYVAPTQGGRTTPSEFSNTSRESFQRAQPPPMVVPRTFRRSDSATPQRTLSRFREDLPEMPISPPDSRVQSPEADEAAVRPSSGKSKAPAQATPDLRPGEGDVTESSGSRPVPIVRKQALENVTGNSVAMNLSQSLASIDSEASWLSGRPSKRASGISLINSVKAKRSSLQQTMPGAFYRSDTDEMIDEGSAAQRGQLQQRSSVDRRTSSVYEDPQGQANAGIDSPAEPASSRPQDELWHSSIGRTPTLVKQAGRAKSKEGLLKEYNVNESKSSESVSTDEDGERDDEMESPSTEVKEAPILRARSIEYKGHIRHMSAGSAKLLDIRRASTHSDLNRASSPAFQRRDEEKA